MDNKNTPIFYYDEEKAKTSKSPILIALTELQQAVLIEVIWKQHNDPNTTWCVEGLDVLHTDVIPKYEKKSFTHYVWVLSEDNVRDWLKTISKHRWHTEDVFKWSSTYQLVFDERNRSSYSLQYILNEVVDSYVSVHGDPRPELNKKLITEVTKQQMLSAKHGGKLPANE